MTILDDFNQFSGTRRETAVIRNVLAYQGHDLSEAMIFGISGGIVAGYFAFEYTGVPPYVHFLTRNTFDPMERVIDALGIDAPIEQTGSAKKAVDNIRRHLKAGQPIIAWADQVSLDYTNVRGGDDMWFMEPVVVYGYTDQAVHIADCAQVPFTVDPEQFAAARARTSSNKHRIMTLALDNLDRLPNAVQAGIQTTLDHMTGPAPRKPMAGKYGLDAFKKWAELLTSGKGKEAWSKKFPPGAAMYSGLKSGYFYIELWGSGGRGARGVYADFLDEAAGILSKPALSEVAGQFRQVAQLWGDFTAALLPFKETRDLLHQEATLYNEKGAASLAERQAISERLDAIAAHMDDDFPLTEAEAAELREHLAEHLLRIHDAEKDALAALAAHSRHFLHQNPV
jgi:hypothetical protein